jgi:ABC-type branched-subunit amino acid transport system substrate-binding protein
VTDTAPIRFGGFAPLSPPGMVAAGEELVAGMRLAVDELNEAGGLLGRSIQLRIVDTRGDPAAGVAAVDVLAADSAVALVGEFHSVVADMLVERVEAIRLPYVCASATMDSITGRRLRHTFRLSPLQSVGWRRFADELANRIRSVGIVVEESQYWRAGAAILERRFRDLGVQVATVGLPSGETPVDRSRAALTSLLNPAGALLDALVPLVGYPDQFAALLGELRRRGLWPGSLLVVDPAGRPALPDWWAVAGPDGDAVPFLAYARSDQLTSRGRAVAERFRRLHTRQPSFVALEGVDALLVLAAAIDAAGSTEPEPVCAALRTIEVEGTRGWIRFTTEPEGPVHQQWTWAPLCMLATETPGTEPRLME